jgi:hypothetical protein
MDEGLDCVVRAGYPNIDEVITREQFEAMRHANVMPTGRMRAGLFQALAHDKRLLTMPPPVDLGTFPVGMAWHVRYRHDPAHRWLRGLVRQVIGELAAPDRR